jgi:hypothetical protein
MDDLDAIKFTYNRLKDPTPIKQDEMGYILGRLEEYLRRHDIYAEGTGPEEDKPTKMFDGINPFKRKNV